MTQYRKVRCPDVGVPEGVEWKWSNKARCTNCNREIFCTPSETRWRHTADTFHILPVGTHTYGAGKSRNGWISHARRKEYPHLALCGARLTNRDYDPSGVRCSKCLNAIRRAYPVS